MSSIWIKRWGKHSRSWFQRKRKKIWCFKTSKLHHVGVSADCKRQNWWEGWESLTDNVRKFCRFSFKQFQTAKQGLSPHFSDLRENFCKSFCPSDRCELLLLLLYHAGQGLPVLLRSGYTVLAAPGTSWSGLLLGCGQAGRCSHWLWRGRNRNLRGLGTEEKKLICLGDLEMEIMGEYLTKLWNFVTTQIQML